MEEDFDWSPYLEDGEEVLWQGRPRRGWFSGDVGQWIVMVLVLVSGLTIANQALAQQRLAQSEFIVLFVLHAPLVLHERALHTFGLDGDNLRRGLCADLGFSAEDRAENIRRAGAVASLMVDAGLLVIAAFISPYAAGREAIRASLPPGRYVECHVVCPIAVCAERDPKGLYARAKAGDLANFTGISAPYEAPEHPELTLHTAPEETTPRGCAHQIVRYLEAQGVIPPSSTT